MKATKKQPFKKPSTRVKVLLIIISSNKLLFLHLSTSTLVLQAESFKVVLVFLKQVNHVMLRIYSTAKPSCLLLKKNISPTCKLISVKQEPKLEERVRELCRVLLLLFMQDLKVERV
jgi:hypothetical protein